MWVERAPVNWRGTFAEPPMHTNSPRATRRTRPRPPIAARDAALRLLVLGVMGMAVAYATAFLPPSLARAGPWLMAVLVPLTLFAILILGAVRNTRPLGRLAWPLLVVFLLVTGGFVLALVLPDEHSTSTLVLGLPARAAVIVFGVGIVPLFMLPLAYALTFDSYTLSDDDIARVRAARQASATPDVMPE
jgi:hypothetical protein